MLVLLVAYTALVLVAPAPPPPSLETGLKATTWYLPLTACTAPPVADDLLSHHNFKLWHKGKGYQSHKNL